jgi:acetylornithine deacetylase/succinyl-diaminopimelate desuccinylase-like protein
VGIYFMYDVKQADPTEWTSPPFEARIVDKSGFGKVLIGRGAVKQRAPEAMWPAALHAFRGARRKLPVNLVFVAEGEEEVGSPHFPQIVRLPDILAAFGKCTGVYMPMPMQAPDGTVTINLGAKGVVELELVSSGERWHRGPKQEPPFLKRGPRR